MFTVRHDCNGNSSIYEAFRVRLNGPQRGEKSSVELEPEHNDVPVSILAGGTVYVMNETGATVARYELQPLPRAAYVLPERDPDAPSTSGEARAA